MSPFSHPRQLGRYVVEKVLGSGSYGWVYLAFDPDLQRRVAIKVPRDDRLEDQRLREAFLREARAAAQLQHRNIVTIHDVFAAPEGLVFIVMEYIEGRTLKQLLRSESPPARSELLRMVAEVAEAAHYAHKRGFIHRDLKPANILVDADGTPKVADFGLALHEAMQHLHRGECAGTPAYMAPEQVSGHSHTLDGRADVWALGVILYQVLTGRRPFLGQNGSSVVDEVCQRDPKPPRQIDDSVPKPLEELCLRCLQKDPTARPTTALDVSRTIRRTMRGRSSSRPAMAVVSAGILLLAALAWSLFAGGVVGPARQSAAEPGATAPYAPDAGDVRPDLALPVASTGDPPTAADAAWQPLLAGKPRVLAWFPFSDLDTYVASGEKQTLTVKSSTDSVFTFGSSPRDAMTLRATVAIDRWVGYAGFVWQVRESERAGAQRTYTGMATYVGRSRESGDFQWHLDRLVIESLPNRSYVKGHWRLKSLGIRVPDETDVVLQVRASGSTLLEVSLDGQTLAASVPLGGEGPGRLPLEPAAGEFGLYSSSGYVVFRDVSVAFASEGR